MVHFHVGLLERANNRKTGSLISQLIEEATATSDDFFLTKVFQKNLHNVFNVDKLSNHRSPHCNASGRINPSMPWMDVGYKAVN